MGKRIQSDFLFAQPSFTSGIASVADFWGQLAEYNSSASGAEADSKALAADWLVTGQDIADALQEAESGRL